MKKGSIAVRSESPISMEQTLLFSSRFTVRGRSYCKLYQIRTFKNKVAILLLVWNTLVMNLLYYIVTQTPWKGVHFISLLFTLPIAGWLADVYFGRYKVIHWSMWTMWVGSILATLSFVVALFIDGYASISKKVTLAILTIQTIGFAGYQANILQFGIDQFSDASTDAIKSFIIWFIWTYFTGSIAGYYMYDCIRKEYPVVGTCFTCTCLAVALVLSFFLHSILIKEPVVQNPYKLVYKVIKYAFKHKYPQYRSAFTYCEDELPSRIDFGKSKYGGPFTTEQVEDVKTFLRVLAVVIFYIILPGVALLVYKQENKIMSLFNHPSNTLRDCIVVAANTDLVFYCAIVLIPLHEFLIYPIMRNYFPWMKSYCKFFLGGVLQVIRIVALMLIEFKARDLHVKHYGSNTTMQCVFLEKDGALSSTFDSRWMILPNLLNSVSIILLGVGTYEFICAQTPYSMRGLTIGAAYGSFAIFTIIGYTTGVPFTRHLSKIDWGTGIISCGFWYLLLTLLLIVVYNAILLMLLRQYKRRKREDVLPNEHFFAEQYYDKD